MKQPTQVVTDRPAKISMSEELNRFDAVRRELAETAQQLRDVTGDPQLRIALLRRMKELLNEVDKIKSTSVARPRL